MTVSEAISYINKELIDSQLILVVAIADNSRKFLDKFMINII